MNTVRRVGGSAAAFAAVVLVVAHAAGGAAPPEPKQEPKREVWKHADGSFVKVKGARWEERDVSDKVGYKFVELTRNAKYVEIYDASRKTTIRLNEKEALIREDGSVNFSKIYEGKWKE